MKQKEDVSMRTLGNILWFLFGGLIGAVAWVIAGLICCITIIGIPLGAQCFKMAGLALFPFHKDVVYGGGGVSLIANILWILFLGWEMALGYIGFGLVWCCTIVGIPFGMQCFKMARLALMPFGATVVERY